MITFAIVWYLWIRVGAQSNLRSSKKGHHLTSGRHSYGTGVKAGKDSILENDGGRIAIFLSAACWSLRDAG